jgi:hypothetical protein
LGNEGGYLRDAHDGGLQRGYSRVALARR